MTSPSQRAPEVLLVDDDDLIDATFRAAFEKLGLPPVVRVADATDAVALLADGKHFDVIFTDLYMPVMDGIELVQHLGKIAYGGAVVMMTGIDFIRLLRDKNLDAPVQIDAETEALSLDLDAILGDGETVNLIRVMRKPFRLEELTEALRDAGVSLP